MLHSVKNILSFSKKAIIVIGVFLLIIHAFLYVIGYNKSEYKTESLQEKRNVIYEMVYDPELQETENGRSAADAMQWITCSLIGEACGETAEESARMFREKYNGSLLGRITNVIIIPYDHPPASGILWAGAGLENAGFIPSTYAAQGIGFSALQPIAPLWKMFRDFVLLLMVLIIVAIGFMIMFRAKLDAQTVIKIESALPKIVVTLIVVVFSFPIAGLMIDLMYILIGFTINLFSTNLQFAQAVDEASFHQYENYYTYENLHEKIFIKDNLDFMESTLGGVNTYDQLWVLAGSIHDLLPTFLQFFVQALAYNLTFYGFSRFFRRKLPFMAVMDVVKPLVKRITGSGTPGISIITAIISVIIELVILNVLGWLIGWMFFFLLLAVSLLVIIFRIFFLLLFAYVRVLIFIIFAPVILMFNAIPGKSTVDVWLKGLGFNLLTFPMVIMLALIANLIMMIPVESTALWRPPYLYSISMESFKMLIAGLILFSIPNIVGAAKQMLGEEQQNFGLSPLNFGTGAVAGLGMVSAPLAQIGSASTAITAIKNIVAPNTNSPAALREQIDEAAKRNSSGGGGAPSSS
jgi:hypothetical protein